MIRTTEFIFFEHFRESKNLRIGKELRYYLVELPQFIEEKSEAPIRKMTCSWSHDSLALKLSIEPRHLTSSAVFFLL